MSTRLINRGERLTAIERMLFRNSQGLRAVEIAKACGVDRRTIYRDLAMLEKLNIPITQEDGRFFINHNYYLASVRLNFHEAIALFVAVRVFARNARQQNPHVVSALNKLGVALPEPLSSHVTYIADWVRGNPVDRNYVQILETITHAWVERRAVKIWGGGKNSDSAYSDFSTYFIEPTATGGLYAIGSDDDGRSVKALKIDAIKRAKLLETHYEIPPDFDRHPYLESVWGIMSGEGEERTKIVLAFSTDVTPLIRERLWHTSQQIETLEDKRCTLSLEVSDWRELLPWIRSWGAQVEVLKPEALRRELALEALRLASVYHAAGTA
jgi:predicted DNA-binding transcriptional regulator YafY